MSKINVKAGNPIGSGSMSLIIANVWVEYGGKKLTKLPFEVPAGAEFHIFAEYAATFPGERTWSTCITVVGDGIENYDITREWSSNPSGTMKLDTLGIPVMPNHDVSLRLRPWGHSEHVYSPPPRSEW